MKDRIRVTQPSMPRFKDYIEEISELWETSWLTNNGIKHQELEKRLREYLGVSNLTLFSSGHMALEGALAALDLTGEVITTPLTFVSTAHALVRNGLKPVFCDVKQDDYTLDPSKIEQLITEKTTAILPVHVYGNICDVEAISDIAEEYKLKVVYDAAHAFAVKKAGRDIASYGDAAAFSFHATKIFQTIEGGAVASQESVVAERMAAWRNFGLADSGSVDILGCNAKMNEFQAAMGLCNLPSVEDGIAQREKLACHYRSRLSGLQGIQLNEQQEGIDSNFAYFPILVDGSTCRRDDLQSWLAEAGITTRQYFSPLVSELTYYSGQHSKSTPIAQYISERVLILPLHAGLTIEDVEMICNLIMQFVKK